jgi:diadenosine tetraphosphate (Ap4A) HIT family hydrolase
MTCRFELDPAFESGSLAVGELALCHVRLQDDARFPWLVLIPRQAGAVELEDLASRELQQLWQEIVLAGQAIREWSSADGQSIDKLNVGFLGNITRQLHGHVIGRRINDPAWPGPVWGTPAGSGLSDPEASIRTLRRLLGIAV